MIGRLYRSGTELRIHSNRNGLPLFQSERTFQMWKYGVGHSQLLLRAAPDAKHLRCLDAHFEGVTAIQLVTRYVGIELRCAVPSEAEAILSFSKLNSPWRDRQIPLLLSSQSGTGFVLCGQVAVAYGPNERFLPGGSYSKEDVLWHLRRSTAS